MLQMKKMYCVLLLTLYAAGPATAGAATDPWLTLPGSSEGAGKGKNIVLIAGANEYNPETGLPALAKILAARHGFNCTVVFTTNPAGAIDPNTNDNIPGLQALDHADLMVILCRFRVLPDEQMKHIADYLERGGPVIGLRTATHSFAYPRDSTSEYRKYSWDNHDKSFDGGFGRQVLGETWIAHRGPNATTSTRAVFAPNAKGSPVLRGIGNGEIWARTGVYEVRLPMLPDCVVLLLGQVIDGPSASDKPSEGPISKPMMPVAWTRSYGIADGKNGRVFTTTMGSADDMKGEPFRRLLINACYWATGLGAEIPEKTDAELVGPWIAFHPGMRPADYLVK